MRTVVKKLLKVSAPIAVLLAGILIVKGLAAARPEPEKTEDETRLVSLYVDEARAEFVQVKVETQGEVRPKTEIDLIPQVSGRIVEMSENFNDGASFRAGDLLLKIDDTDYRLALARAEASVAPGSVMHYKVDVSTDDPAILSVCRVLFLAVGK